MSYHKLSNADLRTSCKGAIEALELWLRRVIDMALCPKFGQDYINAKKLTSDGYIFDERFRGRINKEVLRSPEKYNRHIDATFLKDEICIICHKDLYNEFFRMFFEFSYPLGNDELRFFLEKIAEIRNLLAHSNPISVRQAEQVICYSYDVIDAIKAHILYLNKEKEYNVPTIIKISDSNGLTFYDSQIRRNSTGRGGVQVSDVSLIVLRSGEKLSIEVEIDPSFSPSDYCIKWLYENQLNENDGPLGNRITIDILDCHVREDFTIYCQVISNKSWHRCGDVDDCVSLTYKSFTSNLSSGDNRLSLSSLGSDSV